MPIEPHPPPGPEPPGARPRPGAGNDNWIRDHWDDQADGYAADLQAASAAAEFTQGAPADVMAPGPMLAAVAHDAATAAGTATDTLGGVADLTDNQLAGMIGAGDRLSSWGAALKIAAVAELADRRRTGDAAAIRCGQAISEFAADEVACELTMTRAAAEEYMAFSDQLRQRLPA